MSDGMKRRDFLKVVGVSGAGVATVGCSTGQVEKLIPYTIAPEDIVPGMPTVYASTCRECPAGCGIQVETHEGRVTKVEGTPDHPVSHGNTCARGQASVQGLYHPDRHRGPLLVEQDVGGAPRNVTWAVAEQELARRIRAAGPGGTVLLTGSYGGTMDRLADEFVARVGGRRVVYAPLEDTPRDASFADADYLVSFGADFLETWGSPVDYTWQFSQMHGYRKDGVRGKFVWVGPHRPLTGLNADQWVRPRPGTEAVVARALAGAVAPADAAESAPAPDVDSDAKASPVAKRIAAAEGVDLSGLKGTGAGGKVMKADVLAAADGGGNGASATSASAGEAKALRGPAGMLAKAMEESRSIPTATSFRTLAVDTLDAKRKALNGALSERGLKVSFTHLIAWAIVQAASDWRAMARTFEERDGKPNVVDHGNVNLGIAVDIEKKDGSRALMVPAIKGADEDDF
ncbi:MAG TPA: 2-oxo acid dehydrogenase subunit E2, partial [Longimicrobiaceae bacterium]|nr:2-oxo acid dehydrogenase subunit E2 [Longimicrobiaceae bacterium]